MISRHLMWLLLGPILLAQFAAAQSSPAAKAGVDATLLSSRIWRVTHAPSPPANGSIYIFLSNGTLLETSCVETYRIAKWTMDRKDPSIVRVVEDGQLAFTAKIVELTNTSLRLQQKLVRSNEQRDLRFSAVDKEFVCPDLRK